MRTARTSYQMQKKLVESALELLRSAGYYVDKLWHADDVHFICEQLGIERLDDGQVQQVFEILSESFDGETGISWPQLEQAIQLFMQRQRALRAMCSGPLKPDTARCA